MVHDIENMSQKISESSDNFQIGGISYLGSYRPFITQKKFVPFMGFMVLKTTSKAHSFNAKIGFEKYAMSPEKLNKMC